MVGVFVGCRKKMQKKGTVGWEATPIALGHGFARGRSIPFRGPGAALPRVTFSA
jgi:hypothetical protein